MNTNIVGLYRADITPVERMVQTTVGRKEMLDELLEKLGKSAQKKSVQHFVYIGPRGIGKTHFLTLLEKSVNTIDALKDNYIVIRFPEENNRILSFADLVLGILQALCYEVNNPELRTLYEVNAAIEDDQMVIDAIVPRLKLFRKQTGKMLLVLVENLDTLLTKQLKNQQDIHRLRTFLMDSPCITLVATSPFYFPGMYDIKSPLYDFFDVQVLEELSENQTIEMIRQNLAWEKKYDILEKYDAQVPKIRAIYVMTGGNPRLIMMLYELLANDNILDVKLQFQKLLDQISPFYQDRLKELAPQERAILETLALMRTVPKTPAAIAKQMRKKQQLIAAPLQRMTQAGYLTVIENPDDKRSRIYRIKEGFFDLWLAMSESRLHKTRIPYLVDLFNYWYQDQADREEKRRQLLNECSDPQCNQKKIENSRELLDYLSEIGDKDEKLMAKSDLALLTLKEDARNAYSSDYFKEIEPLVQDMPIMKCFLREAIGKPCIEIYSWFSQLITYWKTKRTGDLEHAAQIAKELGYDFSDSGLHNIRIELLKDALEHTIDKKQKHPIILDIAQSLEKNGKLDEALNYLNHSLTIAREIVSSSQEAETLLWIGYIYQDKELYDQALVFYQQSLEINKRIADEAGEATSVVQIGIVYRIKGSIDQALEFYKNALQILKRIGDTATTEAILLHEIGMIYEDKGSYDQALDFYQQSLEINRRTEDISWEAISLEHIGTLYMKLKKYGDALKYTIDAYIIFKKTASPSVEQAKRDLNRIRPYLPPEQFQSLCAEKGISLEELQ